MNRAVQKPMPPQQQTTTLARSHGSSPTTSRKVQCGQSGLALGTCVKQSGIWKEREEGSQGAQPQSTHSLSVQIFGITIFFSLLIILLFCLFWIATSFLCVCFFWFLVFISHVPIHQWGTNFSPWMLLYFKSPHKEGLLMPTTTYFSCLVV